MNAYRTANLTDLKDSRIQYDKNPPVFGLMLILIAVFILIAAFLWSVFTVKSYVVKGRGTVVSEEKNYIMSAYTGEITEVYAAEGDFVEQGQVLFKVSSLDLDLQAEQIVGMIAVNQEKIEQFQRLENCIKSGENCFDENKTEDKPFYYQYETYQSQIAQKEIDVTAYKSYNYTDGQIELAIRTNEATISEVYYSTLKTIADSVQTLKTEIASYEVQLSSIQNGQSAYPITANVSGFVHMDTEYKVGMVVQAAAAIGSIVRENESYIMAVYASANDMPLLHVGDHAKIAVSGLMQSIYGTIDGTVTYIASEPTVNQENHTSAFLVKIKPDVLYLVSNQGNMVNLSNGMEVEARIQYDEVTYFHYLLEGLGILTR